MLEIYRSFRDADYMAEWGQPRASVFGAIVEAIRVYRLARSQCKRHSHIRLDVWGDRCWHERLVDRIEDLATNPWNDPNLVWTPREPYGLDEVDYLDDLDPWEVDSERLTSVGGAMDSAHWWRDQ